MAVNAVGSSNSASEAQVHVQARRSKEAKKVSEQIVEGIADTPKPEQAPRKHLATA